MTIPTESVWRSNGRRNSLGNERIVTISKPCPVRNSISSFRSVKSYTTTQSVKELSVDDSHVEEMSSKNLTTKTSSIMKTPQSTTVKTITTQLEPPKGSYNRTESREVLYINHVLISKCCSLLEALEKIAFKFETLKHVLNAVTQLA